MQLNRRSLLAAAGALVALVVIIVIIVVLSGDDGDGDATDAPATTTTATTTTTTTTLPAGPYLPLTGEPVDADSPLLEQAAIVVKISNNVGAGGSAQDFGNWRGLDQADVVIEERIEANATRFAAVFHSVLPESVGPIRSGRTSDLDLLTNLGGPILVYSGANPSVTGQLRSLEDDGLVVLVVDRATNVDLVRDTEFSRPDNLYSNLVEILEKYGDSAGIATPLFDYHHRDRGERDDGAENQGVTVRGADTVSFVWDDTRGYVRVQNGEVHDTLDEVPLVFDNVVVLEVVYKPSTFAPGSVDAETVGSGVLNLLIGGKRYEGTWTRESRTDAYSFADAAGRPLRLDPGQTWMTLVPADTYDFEVPAETAELVVGTAG